MGVVKKLLLKNQLQYLKYATDFLVCLIIYRCKKINIGMANTYPYPSYWHSLSL